MIVEPRCSIRACKHFQGVTGEEEVDQICVCAAFPKGIPVDIAYGSNLHLKPVAGDNGIQFEQGEPNG